MTWDTVAQALVLAVGAGAVSRWLAREPSPRRMAPRAVTRVLDAPPPRGHRYDVGIYSAHCTCGWSFTGGVSVSSRRLRREVGQHLQAVAKVEPAATPTSAALSVTGANASPYYLPTVTYGNPQMYCGRDMCALGQGHSGACRV